MICRAQMLVRGLRSGASARLVRPAGAMASQWSHQPVRFEKRSMGSVSENPSARDAWKKSCYVHIDFTIPEDHLVFEAVQRFAAYDIGCLITVDAQGEMSGIISERDYINKIALLGRSSKETQVKEISTKVGNLVSATPDESVDVCMNKMLTRDIRHLPILGDEGNVVGMLSIKDCIKAVLKEKEDCIEMLENFALGKGGTMVVD